jgi:hypothetical protein
MTKLEAIAGKELSGAALNETEVTFLKTMINDFMASGPSVTGWYNELFFDIEKGLGTDFTVADVHTQPTDYGGALVGNVLHVGNGKVNIGIFFAGNTCDPGQVIAYAGPVSSFHQVVMPNFKRLTDQEWEDSFWGRNELISVRPDWVASYLTDRNGNLHPEGRMLKGSVYTGTGITPGGPVQPADYMVLFPNPSTGEAALRFLLREKADLRLSVFDASGRLVHHTTTLGLLPAEHHLALPAERWDKGLYLVRVEVGRQVFARELVVQ